MMDCVLSVPVEMWLYHPLASASQSWGSGSLRLSSIVDLSSLIDSSVCINLSVESECPVGLYLHQEVSAILLFWSVFNLFPKDAFPFTCKFDDNGAP